MARRSALSAATALALALALGVTASPALADPPAKGWRADMLASVNAERAAAGVGAVRLCPRLSQVANAYARTMARTDHFDHIGPDGKTPWDRMKVRGYDYTAAAENIAAGQGSVGEVQAGWVESPGHYANMTNADVTDAGFGFARAKGSTYGTYWVQVFGAGGSCS